MCVPFWMLDTFLFVCVYEDRKLYLTVYFVGKPHFRLFCVALFCKGQKGGEQNSEEKPREAFCLIRVRFGLWGFFFVVVEPAHSLALKT